MVGLCALLIPILGCHRQSQEIAVIDPLIKILQHDSNLPTTPYQAEVARGEYAEWEVVLDFPKSVDGLHVSVTSFAGSGGAVLPQPRVRTEGYVHVDQGAQKPAHDRIASLPNDFPDPLLEEVPAHLEANTNLPLWIDIPVEQGAAPGAYAATVTVTGNSGGQSISLSKPLNLQVYKATVGKSRLWVTQWFGTWSGHMPGPVKAGTPAEDAYLTLIANRMAAHRQNIAYVSAIDLAKYTWDSSGKMTVDFSRFDDWVNIFIKAGVIGRIEGGHVGGRLTSDWHSQYGLAVKRKEGDKITKTFLPPDNPQVTAFYSQFLPQLLQHLKDKGWLGQYMQHVADEPIDDNAASYAACAQLVRKYLPGVKIIDATHTTALTGLIDIWVPQLDIADKNADYFRSRQKAGDEWWFYTCIQPQGEYANRFIELPLIKTRLLQWIDFRYGMTGYLHWGYNSWVAGDPFEDVTRSKSGRGTLPAGDPWIVYPKDGKLLDSIRYETMRDAIGDYELLSLVNDKDPKTAQSIVRQAVTGFASYNTDVGAFRSTRRSLLEALGN